MAIDITKRLTERFRNLDSKRNVALAEVLCSAYKDATGAYPNDRLREAFIQAVEYES